MASQEEADISLPLDGLEGDITVPQPSKKAEDSGTLDEPVWTTLKRDVTAVGYKFTHVLFPRRSKQLLYDWDLWGPLCLCIVMAILLHGGKVDEVTKESHNPQFVEVFVIVWAGSFIVALNSKLLGGTLSFFQSLCALGYCLLPLVISLLMCEILDFMTVTAMRTFFFFIKLVVVVAGLVWAIVAAFAFISDSQPARRKGLALYPVFLFYFGISVLILMRQPSD
ncbi:protein YIPF6-like [Sycon ciliatum]|uniref:protein YIPF6-like n=1 Tax=Sycon ciliatum TaxID=27933 RepID=UPI0031F6C2F3